MDPAIITVTLVFAFFASALVAAFATKSRNRFPAIPGGRKCTIRCNLGRFETTTFEHRGASLLIHAPFKEGVVIPVRKGDSIFVEVPLSGDVLSFRGKVCDRSAESKTLTIALPEHFRLINRRMIERIVPDEYVPTKVNGHPALLMDYSNFGAKILTREPLEAGDVVRVHLPNSSQEFMGYVLSSIPDILEGRMATQARVTLNG